jgi:hypothetical protein
VCDYVSSSYADNTQNIAGMSVVGADFDKLKRFNIEELSQAAAPSRGSDEVPDAAKVVKTQ